MRLHRQSAQSQRKARKQTAKLRAGLNRRLDEGQTLVIHGNEVVVEVVTTREIIGAMEAENNSVIDALKPVMPRIVDAFQVHLRELRGTDLEGSAGLFRVREELTRRVNLAIAPNRIRAVLFKEIMVQ